MRIKFLPVIICVIFVSAILCLPSCSRTKPQEKENPLVAMPNNFDTTAAIKYKELSATAKITKESPQSCSVTFTSPESLKDVSFVFYSDKVDLSYKSLSFTFEPTSVPGSAVASMAIDAINASLNDKGISVDYTDNALTLLGKLDSGDFTLSLGAENNNLIKLSIPEQDLQIEFFNFTFLE